jgi:hypothetical protein
MQNLNTQILMVGVYLKIHTMMEIKQLSYADCLVTDDKNAIVIACILYYYKNTVIIYFLN